MLEKELRNISLLSPQAAILTVGCLRLSRLNSKPARGSGIESVFAPAWVAEAIKGI